MTVDDNTFEITDAVPNDGCLTFGYTPVPGADGCDVAVTHIRIRPQGVFAADTGGGSPEAQFSFRVAVN